MSKESRAAYDEEIAERMREMSEPHYSFGIGPSAIGLGLALIVHLIGMFGQGQAIIALLKNMMAFLNTTFMIGDTLVVMLCPVGGLVIIYLVILFLDFPGKWLFEIPAWFVAWFLIIALVASPIFRFVERFYNIP